MSFTLRCFGRLKSAQSKDRGADEKSEIRVAFSKQLRQVWNKQPKLAQYGVGSFSDTQWKGQHADVERPWENMPFYRLRLSGEHTEGKFIVPIVSRYNSLTCAVDIRLHRFEQPGTLMHNGGDLDGRIKTLVDGLTVPQDIRCLETWVPEAPDMFLILLEDDSLITRFSVEAIERHDDPPLDVDRRNVIAEVAVTLERSKATNQNFLLSGVHGL